MIIEIFTFGQQIRIEKKLSDIRGDNLLIPHSTTFREITVVEEQMAAIPITLGTVSKVRSQWDADQNRDKDLLNAKTVQSNYNVHENPPAKYSYKFMNSIWGLYNRYAPPSFQKNSEGEIQNGTQAVALGGWCLNQQS